ncbi:hypothetical protein VM98_39065, partial [Streptomyces rubellomurinus subsp. indigoferus]
GAGRVPAAEALAAARCEDVLEALVDGTPDCGGAAMRARVAERGRALSGGRRRRDALARPLVADGPVPGMYEPTGAVDANTEARAADALPGPRAARTDGGS